jgi:AmiR/NasT family two-component response regulator
MLLDGQEQALPGRADAGLDEALDDRFELHQAQGMVMVQLGISLGDALTRIRAHAFANNHSLGNVAADVVSRRIRFDRDTRD